MRHKCRKATTPKASKNKNEEQKQLKKDTRKTQY